jgi:hypothetical protein
MLCHLLSLSPGSAFTLAFSFPCALLLQFAAFVDLQTLCGCLLVSGWVSQGYPVETEVVEEFFKAEAAFRFSKSNSTPSGVFNKTVTGFLGTDDEAASRVL